MKRFASLFLAAVLGSVSTVATFEFLNNGEESQLGYTTKVPSAQVSYTTKNENGQTVPLDFTETADRVTKAVVHIRSTTEGRRSSQQDQQIPEAFREFFGPRMQEQGPSQSAGSGVIINADGYIITNNHVVQDADVVDVTLLGNRSYKAEVIGTDPDTDLALIKIKETGLPYLAFVDSDVAKVGQWVLAVGNPFNLNSTVTAGIISAKGRSINILNRNTQEGNTAIESFIQTDAAINPGNSGGALVDLNGGLLGINTAIASPTGAYSGYGFAVPSNLVNKVVEDLLKFGIVQRGWLGVSIASVNSDIAREKNLNVNEGAYVNGFAENSSAKSGGVKEGDVIVKIDQAAIHSSTALMEYIGRHRPGDKINVVVNRNGKEITLPITLTARNGTVATIKREEKSGFASLGLEVEDIDAKVLKKLDIENGVRVKELGDGKLARFTDLQPGFIITRVNDAPVNSVKELSTLLKNKKQGDLVILSGVYENSPREFNYAFRM